MRLAVTQTPEAPTEWEGVQAIPLGEGPARHYLRLEKEGAPKIRFELRETHRPESWVKVEAIFWRQRVVVGFGERVYVVGRSPTDVLRGDLMSYFSSLRPEADSLLVVGGVSLTRLDDAGAVVWRSRPMGLGGVIVKDIADGLVSGAGCYDPPDDWAPFAVSWTDGC